MTQLVDGELVILDLEAGKVHQLNPTARFIWSCCDGLSSVDSIAARLASEFDVGPETALRDVEIAVKDFQGRGLLAPQDLTESQSRGSL